METPLNILLTGFTPFGDLPTNPSQQIVEVLSQRAQLNDRVRLHGVVLETTYASAGNQVRSLIAELRPAIAVLLGVSAKQDRIAVERFAINMDDAEKADNAGQVRNGQPILRDGPAAYRATLPVDELCQHLKQAGLRAKPSNHAGTYVCNHVFYRALHEVHALGLPSLCGFLHVPMPSVKNDSAPSQSRPTIEDLTHAIQRTLTYLLSIVETDQRSPV